MFAIWETPYFTVWGEQFFTNVFYLQALEKKVSQEENQEKNEEEVPKICGVMIGENCKNNGCKTVSFNDCYHCVCSLIIRKMDEFWLCHIHQVSMWCIYEGLQKFSPYLLI